MATANNVKLRVPLGRSLTYDELDTNFQELKYVISEFNQFVIDQAATNNDLQDVIDSKLGRNETAADSDLLGGVSHEEYVTEAPENGIQYTRIDGTWQPVQTTQSTWGAIQGTLSDQTDLENRLQSIENIKFNVTTTSSNKTLEHTERCYALASGLVITLPANPDVGMYVSVGVKEYTDVVIARNGKRIMGLAENMIVDIENATVTLTYVNATEGWRII